MVRPNRPTSIKRIAILLSLLSGCASRNFKADHPVVGPAPPRLSPTLLAREDAKDEARDDDAEINALFEKETAPDPVRGGLKVKTAGGGSGSAKVFSGFNSAATDFEVVTPKGELPAAMVVARANGFPILAGEILQRHGPELAEARGKSAQLSLQGDKEGAAELRGQIRTQQEKYIREELGQIVEQRLMADALKSRLKKEQMDKVETQFDQMFESHTKGLQDRMKCDSTIELEARLQMMGTSLPSLRKNFEEQMYAEQYIKAKIQGLEKQTIPRQELLRAYNERSKEFTTPAEVKWQEIQISFAKHGGKQEAQRVVDHAVHDLRNGMPFDEAVPQWSDGITLKQKGYSDWTQIESLANPELKEALSALALDEEFRVISTEKAHRILRVTGRRAAKKTPFEQVQDELREKLTNEHRREAAEQVLSDLRKNSVIDLHPAFADLAEKLTK